MACPDAILWPSERPFMGARPQVGAHPDLRQCSSGQCLSCMRPTPHFTGVQTACDARPDEVCFKEGRTPFISAFPEISPPSLTFLWIFDTITLIHEDPTVQTQIRLRKCDPSTRVYVSTDWFEVFS
jgi:hypothetical protein